MSSTEKHIAFLCSQIRQVMKKYILILNAIELLKQLVNGKRVKGVLYIDTDTGKLTFKAYNLNSQKRQKDRLICPLATGWLKESRQRIKFFSSVKKEIGVAEINNVMERDLDKAMSELLMAKLDELL